MTAPHQDDNSWRITVDVPMHLPDSERHKLFDAVVTVVGKWEPEDRDGWDVSMSAGPADHTAEAYVERLEAELDRLKDILSAEWQGRDAALALARRRVEIGPIGADRAAFAAIVNALQGKQSGGAS